MSLERKIFWYRILYIVTSIPWVLITFPFYVIYIIGQVAEWVIVKIDDMAVPWHYLDRKITRLISKQRKSMSILERN